jgi:hypothetical protein
MTAASRLPPEAEGTSDPAPLLRTIEWLQERCPTSSSWLPAPLAVRRSALSSTVSPSQTSMVVNNEIARERKSRTK